MVEILQVLLGQDLVASSSYPSLLPSPEKKAYTVCMMHAAIRHSPRNKGGEENTSLAPSLSLVSPFCSLLLRLNFSKALQELRRPIRYTHFMAPYPTDGLKFFARGDSESQKYLYDPSTLVRVGKHIFLFIWEITHVKNILPKMSNK